MKPKLAGRGKVCARLCSIHGSKEGIRWSWPMLLEADSSKVSTRRTIVAMIIARVATLAPWQQQGKEKSWCRTMMVMVITVAMVAWRQQLQLQAEAMEKRGRSSSKGEQKQNRWWCCCGFCRPRWRTMLHSDDRNRVKETWCSSPREKDLHSSNNT